MDFDAAFDHYLADWTSARRLRASHDQLRHLFTAFLRDAFPSIQAADLDLERYVRALEVRGYIDLLYRDLVFEFKRDLEIERSTGEEELLRYLKTRSTNDSAPLGIITDGGTFHVFVLDGDNLRPTESFVLTGASHEVARLWLDSYLFAGRQIVPTADDIARRFGPQSAVFVNALVRLNRAWLEASSEPAVATKFGEWDNLLAHVYGSPVGSPDLFLRHTYLALLSRLIAYIALQQRIPEDVDLLGTVEGSAFDTFGIINLVEGDFFSWVLEGDVAADALSLLRGLSAHISVYRLDRIDEDVLKEVYQLLVDPDSRKLLGEFYTPDWLAEWTLRESNFNTTDDLLDPSCGSGTFLFTAVQLLRAQGLRGHHLVRHVFQHVAGLDVHPLAVMIAKANLLLALLPDLRDTSRGPLPPIPIFMANTLALAAPGDQGVEVPIHVPDEAHLPQALPSAFSIPSDLAGSPQVLDGLITAMADLASETDADDEDLMSAFASYIEEKAPTRQAFLLRGDFRLLRWLIEQKRDSVWAFILKNAYRPTYFAERKFSLVAGNPPWLPYRDIVRRDYQAQVRNLVVREYELLAPTEGHLFTHMDLSTLFFAHATAHFLSSEGRIAFVMPRSVLTGAQQHQRFQVKHQFIRVLDLETVTPLFRLPSCVIISNGRPHDSTPAPVLRLEGSLPKKNASFLEAEHALKQSASEFEPLARPAQASSYYGTFAEGATLNPRTFWFVEPAPQALTINPDRPQVVTATAVYRQAREPWRDIRFRGAVEKQFVFASLLAEDLIPFAVRRFRPVVVPLLRERPSMEEKGEPYSRLLSSRGAAGRGYTGLARWMRDAEEAWSRLGRRRERTQTPNDRLDYNSYLSRQTPESGFKVVYNKSGTHVACAVVDAGSLREVDGLHVNGLLLDQVVYYSSFESEQEAFYLSAFLNSPWVDDQIKRYQPKGSFGAQVGRGERHITRLPFEVLNLPPFDGSLVEHRRLAALATECGALVAAQLSAVTGSVGPLRTRIRQELKDQLDEIDGLLVTVIEEQVGPKEVEADLERLL
jgi:hypothetical protein